MTGPLTRAFQTPGFQALGWRCGLALAPKVWCLGCRARFGVELVEWLRLLRLYFFFYSTTATTTPIPTPTPTFTAAAAAAATATATATATSSISTST